MMYRRSNVRRGLAGPRLKNRDGFSLILTVFLLTALIGIAAFGIDISMMQVYRAQLHSAADAAALAGAVGLANNEGIGARADAVAWAGLNPAARQTSILAASDVHPGRWVNNA